MNHPKKDLRALHNPKKDLIQSIHNALRLLRVLAREPDQGAAELARELGLNRSTVYRLLWTLESMGAVQPGRGAAGYTLGPFLLDLALADSWDQTMIELSLPVLVRLRTATRETVGLYLARSAEVICAEILESPYEIRRTTRRGDVLVLPRGATAKCYLAWRVTRVPDPEQFLTSIGVQPGQVGQSLQELAEIRDQGYAASRNERVPGGYAIAAPVCERFGKICAVVTVSGPISRLAPDQADDFIAAVRTAAAELAATLQGDGTAQPVHRRRRLVRRAPAN